MAKTNASVKGRPALSPSGVTKPTTFRVPPSGLRAIKSLSEMLDLRSQAVAIELAAQQLLAALERAEKNPPLTHEQLAVVKTAVRAAGVSVRTLGASANHQVVLVATVLAHEPAAVPSRCTAAEYGELLDVVKRLSPGEAIWAMAAGV